MLKACSLCGKIHDAGFDCREKKKEKKKDVSYSENIRKLRSSNKWTDKSLYIRQCANYLCEVCREQGYLNYKGLEVHHIEPIREAPQKAYDNDNLICLCTTHHKQAEAGLISRKYLKKIASKRERNTRPVID